MLKLELMYLSMLLLPLISNTSMWLIASSMIISTPIMYLMLTQQMSIKSSLLFSDLMSSTLIILTVWVSSMMILASSKIFCSNNQPNLFLFMIISLLMILINCFMSPNLLMFYMWFEASLIPTMLLIMMWGYQQERSQASMYLIIYTVTASLPMLLSIYKIFHQSKTPMMFMYTDMTFTSDFQIQKLGWLMVLGGFLVKLPMFLTHLWLPKAHVEAPVAGSMILAAILLKLGGYGIMRMVLLFHHTSSLISPLIMSISLVGAVITSLICIRQTDLKSLIAYSSVGHMGLMLAGVMTSSSWGMSASLTMMIAHGLSSSALFAMANINYEMTSTRSLFLTKGMMVIMPTLSMWWFMFTASNMASPPTINLLSEILLMTSILSKSIMSMLPLILTSFITVAYSLYMFTSTNHGPMSPQSNSMSCLKQKEYTLMIMHLAPLAMLITKAETILL